MYRRLVPGTRIGRLGVAGIGVLVVTIAAVLLQRTFDEVASAVLGGIVVALLTIAILRIEMHSRRVAGRLHEIEGLRDAIADARKAVDGVSGLVRAQRDSSLAGIAELSSQVSKLDSAFADQRKLTDSIKTYMATRSGIEQNYRQIQAMLNLFSMFDVEGEIPPMRGWAASPDITLHLVEIVRLEKPQLIVECGSGVSTFWLAKAAEKYSPDSRIISLDHEPTFAAKSRALLDHHGLSRFAEIRDAPLEKNGETQAWYSPAAWHDIENIDLLFVDGPPKDSGPLARRPALYALADKVSRDGTIVLDDAKRDEELAILKEWSESFPEFSQEILGVEKHAGVLRRTP